MHQQREVFGDSSIQVVGSVHLARTVISRSDRIAAVTGMQSCPTEARHSAQGTCRPLVRKCTVSLPRVISTKALGWPCQRNAV